MDGWKLFPALVDLDLNEKSVSFMKEKSVSFIVFSALS